MHIPQLVLSAHGMLMLTFPCYESLFYLSPKDMFHSKSYDNCSLKCKEKQCTSASL